MTTEEALAELTAYLADPPVPEGYYSQAEILAQAKAQGMKLTDNMLTDRLHKALQNGTIVREKYGKKYYYRKVKE